MNREMLLQSLARTITDYRQNEIAPMTISHIERWLNQFDTEDQLIILIEMNRIMKQFYFSRGRVKECLRTFLKNEVIGTNISSEILSQIHFLRVQRIGSSQEAMLDLIDELLREEYNMSITSCGTAEITKYIYIDDCTYTGSRLRYDLTNGSDTTGWISTAPVECMLIIYTLASHTEGANYAARYINAAALEKKIRVIRKTPCLTINNKRWFDNDIDILWPEDISDDAFISSYVSSQRTMLSQKGWSSDGLFRHSGSPSEEKLFSSLSARRVVEEAFLKKGIQIVQASQRPAESMRPLGFIKIGSLGFGTFFVTYRNIANNCPLVLWWGDPSFPSTHPLGKWYPLFPRRTNVQHDIV